MGCIFYWNFPPEEDKVAFLLKIWYEKLIKWMKIEKYKWHRILCVIKKILIKIYSLLSLCIRYIEITRCAHLQNLSLKCQPQRHEWSIKFSSKLEKCSNMTHTIQNDICHHLLVEFQKQDTVKPTLAFTAIP